MRLLESDLVPGLRQIQRKTDRIRRSQYLRESDKPCQTSMGGVLSGVMLSVVLSSQRELSCEMEHSDVQQLRQEAARFVAYVMRTLLSKR